MKKIVLYLMMLVFMPIVAVAVAEPIRASSAPDSDIERVVKGPKELKVPQKSTTEESEAGIHNCIVSPVLDNNLNRFYVAIYYFTKVKVPQEGLSFKLNYYRRVWEGNAWGEWVAIFLGDKWFFTKEDSLFYHLEAYFYFLEEKGSIPPSKAEFKLEMNVDDNLVDTFVPARGPRLESESYDNDGYLPVE